MVHREPRPRPGPGHEKPRKNKEQPITNREKHRTTLFFSIADEEGYRYRIVSVSWPWLRLFGLAGGERRTATATAEAPISYRIGPAGATIRYGVCYAYFLLNILDSRHAQLAKYAVFDEESESEVKKCKILEPGREE